ncbi:MAG: hypothetical protein U0174_16915 [Polyangiaceae bacterium]
MKKIVGIASLFMGATIIVAVGCGATEGAGADFNPGVIGGPCTTTADCEGGQTCAYAEAEGCSASGRCVSEPTGACAGVVIEGCACDGTTIDTASCSFPSKYSAKPLRHLGSCASADGGSDASTDAKGD